MTAPLHRLLFAVHDMSWRAVDQWRAVPVSDRPPLLAEQLPDGWLFLHDGRHRATAAYEDGLLTVPVVLLPHVGPRV